MVLWIYLNLKNYCLKIFEYAAYLCTHIDCFTRMVICHCKVLCSKRQASLLTGLLSLLLSSSAILTANKEDTKVMYPEKEKTMKNCKRGEYAKYFPAVKIEIVEVCCLAWIIETWNLTHKVDTIELDYTIAYNLVILTI